MNAKLKYFIIGFLFGCCFPIGAFVFSAIQNNLSFTIKNFVYVHNVNPLHYMIDSAPMFLGLFALIGGFSKSKSIKLLNEFKSIAEMLSINTSQLSKGSNEIFTLLKQRMYELTQDSNEIEALNYNMTERLRETKNNSSNMKEKSEIIFSDASNLISINDKIKDDNASISRETHELIKNIENITALIQETKEIGKQISILAINSGIEASRLGEQGNSFKEISANVKSLADKTKNINEKLEKLHNESGKNINLLKRRLSDNEKIMEEVSNMCLNIENNLSSYKSAIQEVISHIEFTFDINTNQRDKLLHINRLINDIETLKSEMITYLETSINKEANIVSGFSVKRKN